MLVLFYGVWVEYDIIDLVNIEIVGDGLFSLCFILFFEGVIFYVYFVKEESG